MDIEDLPELKIKIKLIAPLSVSKNKMVQEMEKLKKIREDQQDAEEK